MKRPVYAYVALAALSLAVGAASIVFSVNYVQGANHKFCAVISAYTSGPAPVTGAGQVRTAQFAELGRELGCRARP